MTTLNNYLEEQLKTYLEDNWTTPWSESNLTTKPTFCLHRWSPNLARGVNAVKIRRQGNVGIETYLEIDNARVEIFCRSYDSQISKVMAWMIRDLLHRKNNLEMGEAYVFASALISGPYLQKDPDIELPIQYLSFHVKVREDANYVG